MGPLLPAPERRATVADCDCWRSRSIVMCNARLQNFVFDFFDSHFFALRFTVVLQCPKFDSQSAMRNRINYSLQGFVARTMLNKFAKFHEDSPSGKKVKFNLARSIELSGTADFVYNFE